MQASHLNFFESAMIPCASQDHDNALSEGHAKINIDGVPIYSNSKLINGRRVFCEHNHDSHCNVTNVPKSIFYARPIQGHSVATSAHHHRVKKLY